MLRLRTIEDDAGNSVSGIMPRRRRLAMDVGEDLLAIHTRMPRGVALTATAEIGRPADLDTNQVCILRGVGIGGATVVGTNPDGSRRLAGHVEYAIGMGNTQLLELVFETTRSPSGIGPEHRVLLKATDSTTGLPIAIPEEPFCAARSSGDKDERLTLQVPIGVTNVDLWMGALPYRTVALPWPNPNRARK